MRVLQRLKLALVLGVATGNTLIYNFIDSLGGRFLEVFGDVFDSGFASLVSLALVGQCSHSIALAVVRILGD